MAKTSLKIGYLIQNGAPNLDVISGPQLHILHTIKGLQSLGHHVRVIVQRNTGIVWSDDLEIWEAAPFSFSCSHWFRWVERIIRRIQTVLALPFLGLFDSLHYADACIHLLNGYDILYERHGWMGYGGVIAARRLRIPIVEELNGNIVKEIEVQGLSLTPVQWQLSRWITRGTYQFADHIVVVSNALKMQLETNFSISPELISVIVNGADISLFSQNHADEKILEKYSLDSEARVTFVGSFQPWHGVDLLVSSFAKVNSIFPSAQLILIGDGVGLDDVKNQITDLGLEGKVILLGRLPQNEVANILNASDVLVAPYPFQNTDVVGTPLKLIEYMAAGKAIVASTAPIHEIIVDMESGIRVPPADKDSLADAICRLLGDAELRSRLGAEARRHSKEYSWDKVAETLSALFTSLLQAQTNQ